MTDAPQTTPDAASAPSADPGPPPPPPGVPTGMERFFTWVSGLGMVRADGWIGGVCAAIAGRLGIDPIIVRGVFVVAALFGLPVFLVYAVGWALLPDLAGRIHLRELLLRRFDPAMVGIAILLVLGLVPVVPWTFGWALPFGVFDGGVDVSPLGVLSTLLLAAIIGGVIYLIARSSSRAPASGAPLVTDPRTASADPSAPGHPAPDDSGLRAPADPAPGDAVASSGEAGSALTPPAAASASPPPTASEDELAAWRAQHAAWKTQDDAWRRQQQDAERAARDRARAERAAAGAAFAAEAAERRRVRRATNPRTSVGYVILVIGAALVAGAALALWHGTAQPGEPVLSVAVGLCTAAVVTAIAMIVAGIVRRRSGFLAFLTVLFLAAGSITAVAPLTRGIVFGSTYVSADNAQSFTQLWGNLDIYLSGGNAVDPDPIVIEKRSGNTSITVDPGVILTLEVVAPQPVNWWRWNMGDGDVVDEGTWSGTATEDGRMRVRQRIVNLDPQSDVDPVSQTVRLDQSAGTVDVTINQIGSDQP